MRAGSLRHRVAIQSETSTPNGMGGFSVAWSNIDGMDSVPAKVMPLSSREQLDTMKLEADISGKVRIRYRAGLSAKNRMIFKTRILQITGSPINYDEKNKTLDFLVTEDI